ncbi:MAG TPA: divergent polysaccharide deacetylase family protein [Methylomirabilota bacterium]|nr:divergent polysaccharide deacetylase family protein [Methylomirabilota bacterium]
MPARVWTALAGLIAVLLVAVVGLDQWQSRRGEVSLFGLPWLSLPAPATPLRAPAAPKLRDPRPAQPASPAPPAPQAGPGPVSAPRVAVIIDNLGARRDVFDPLRDIRRPLTVAILPGLPLSEWTAREAAQAGMEVILDLPMEPYRFPEVDPGPGALLMAMGPQELQAQVGAHLASVPGAVGVTNHMGSRMTEDRTRMRTVLEVLAGRRLFLVDGLASNLSVAYDEAKALGLRAGRRQIVVDHAAGEAGDRVRWDEVAWWAERRGEVIVIAHGHPLTARLLREYVSRWEARGIRLVPVSQLAK